MKLSELTKICNDKLEKYGDRIVFTEARKFDCHLVDIKYAGMTMSDEDYKDDPSMLDHDTPLGSFLIILE